jgi:inorganic pyrophosphatase
MLTFHFQISKEEILNPIKQVRKLLPPHSTHQLTICRTSRRENCGLYETASLTRGISGIMELSRKHGRILMSSTLRRRLRFVDSLLHVMLIALTSKKGDNDPLDVCDISETVGYPGQIKQVKVLGVMALLDEEETDWKVIVIDVNDPLAPKLNDVEDVERHLPGLLRATNEWFRIYKIPDGKPENQFAFTGECKNKKYDIMNLHSHI